MSLHHLKSKLGTVTITTGKGTLERLEFDHPEAPENPNGKTLDAVLGEIADSKNVVRLAPFGTPFQVSVWKALMKIQPSETTSYGKIAKDIGRPAASRAVGTAIGSNPISLIIPCHRVITSGGQLGGYRWNVDRKQQLLDWEKMHVEPLQALFDVAPNAFTFKL